MKKNPTTQEIIAELKRMIHACEILNNKTIRPQEVWFDAAIVCKTLKIDEKKLANYRRNYRIPCLRDGNKLYYQMLRGIDKNCKSFIIETLSQS